MADILKTPDNVPPAFIEGMLLDHPDVADAGVIGIYEASREHQLVRAYVVKEGGSRLTEDELIHWMERETAETSHLRGGVVFLSRLPRDQMGKLQRRVLKERASEELGRGSVPGMTLAQP